VTRFIVDKCADGMTRLVIIPGTPPLAEKGAPHLHAYYDEKCLKGLLKALNSETSVVVEVE